MSDLRGNSGKSLSTRSRSKMSLGTQDEQLSPWRGGIVQDCSFVSEQQKCTGCGLRALRRKEDDTKPLISVDSKVLRSLLFHFSLNLRPSSLFYSISIFSSQHHQQQHYATLSSPDAQRGLDTSEHGHCRANMNASW